MNEIRRMTGADAIVSLDKLIIETNKGSISGSKATHTAI